LSGQAYFFTMETFGVLEMVTDVAGAEVYLLEAPGIRQTLDPAEGFAFTLGGIPDHCEVTLALVHDDFFPHLTATLPVGTVDLERIHFQSVSRELIELATSAYGVDPDDTTRCHMATTVTAISDNQDEWWAVGEPGATVGIDPPVPEDSGPIYFNASVIPDLTLAETSTDGGVVVYGVDPGVYTWTAHKESLSFDSRKLTCVGGFVANAAPPWGLQAYLAE
jgi:hypothetical protein